MPSYKYHHIHICSPDPAKTARLYENMFGARVVKEEKIPDGRTNVELDLGGIKIFFITSKVEAESGTTSSPPAYGLDHLGLITDDIEAAAANLKANGLKFRQEVTELGPGFKIAFLEAPDNVLIELVERKD
jgi:catechol 2,3-dioxygenase-like lactoylglutathione lyase family enzyme